MYSLNIILQSFFSLVFPAGITLLLSYLAVRYLGAPEWIYAPLLVIGILSGLVSMVRFIITAMNGLSRLEKENEISEMEKSKKEARDKERLSGLSKNGEDNERQ